MNTSEPSTSTVRKHHRIHPITDHNDNQKVHTILSLYSNEDDANSSQTTNHLRANSQTSSASSSIDVRATDVIKRITSPPSTMSNTDEILPQTFFRRMSNNFTMNSLVTTPTTVLPAIHDVHSSQNHDEQYAHSILTTITNLNSTNNSECEICYSSNECENLQLCQHRFCHSCLEVYLVDKIRNGCPALLECPQTDCKQIIHPDDIKRIVNDNEIYERYETFMLKRVLQKLPDTRWCPYVLEFSSRSISFSFETSYPNCDFALLMENTRKASPYDCPVCHRPFCQRCSQVWHPNLTCDLASAQRAAQDPTLEMLMQSSANGGNIRPCPRCKLSFFTKKKNKISTLRMHEFFKEVLNSKTRVI